LSQRLYQNIIIWETTVNWGIPADYSLDSLYQLVVQQTGALPLTVGIQAYQCAGNIKVLAISGNNAVSVK